MKAIKRIISVPTLSEHTLDTQADIINGFAIHKSFEFDDSWTVTHVRTGAWLFDSIPDKKTATRVAEELDSSYFDFDKLSSRSGRKIADYLYAKYGEVQVCLWRLGNKFYPTKRVPNRTVNKYVRNVLEKP